MSDRVYPLIDSVDVPLNAAVLVGPALLSDARASNPSDDSEVAVVLTDDEGATFSTTIEHLYTFPRHSLFRTVGTLAPNTRYTATLGDLFVTHFTTGTEIDDEAPLPPILIHHSVRPGGVMPCAGLPVFSSIGDFEIVGEGPFYLLHDSGGGPIEPNVAPHRTVLSDSSFVTIDGSTCHSLPVTIARSTTFTFSTMDRALNESDHTEPIEIRGPIPLLCTCTASTSSSPLAHLALLLLVVTRIHAHPKGRNLTKRCA